MAKPKPKTKTASKVPFLRLLPILIFVGALMLSVRVGDIWKGMAGFGSVQVGNELVAEQPPRGGAAAPAPAQQTAAKPPEPAKPAETTGGSGEAPAMSPTEMDVLQKLSQRRTQLDTREKDIERRESLLKAAEDQIERKIAEMKSLRGTIESLLRQYNDQEDSKMRSLVKIYENMKPKEAAKIFEQLDMEIMLEVVERMKEQKVAPILAEMDPVRARTLTSELAQRRQMPMPKPSSGG